MQVETQPQQADRADPWKQPAELIAILAERFPVFAPDIWMPHKPLKVGIYADLAALGVLTGREIHVGLSYYCRRLMYQQALAAGGPRYDLMGNPAGEVSESDRVGAATVVENILKRRENQRDQAKKKLETQRTARTTEPAKPEAPAPAPVEVPRKLDGFSGLKAALAARKAQAVA
jgi:sRNA-binding protein